MIGSALVEGGIVGLLEQPWVKVKIPPPISDEQELGPTLQSLDDLPFAELIQAHLLPRENQPGGRRRWVALWETISGNDRLADRTFDVLEDFLDATEAALAGGTLDDAAAARATKFRRACSEAWKRVQNVEDEGVPLAWAGRAASAFNPVSRKVIAQLIDAIDRHRQTVQATETHPGPHDQQLWAVLRQVSLDPARSRASGRTRG